MDTSPLSEYRARPGQSMEDHVTGVVEGAATLTEGAGQNPFGDDWSDMIETLAWVHDIGKLTQYFQQYVETGDRSHAELEKLTYHGTFGGLVAAFALSARGMEQETTAAGFYAVAKHHSVLGNVPSDIGGFHEPNNESVDEKYCIAQKQLSKIDETAAEAANVLLDHATCGEYGWEDLTENGIGISRKIIKSIDKRDLNDQFYGCVLKAWSTLVTADKADASGLNDSGTLSLDATKRPSTQKLTEHVRSISDAQLPDGRVASEYLDEPSRSLPSDGATLGQRLAALRTAANGRAERSLRERVRDGERVFELTLPTGFGKTFSGLRAALSVADDRDSRVVYALPYTSIIDQVDEQIQSIFDVTPTDPAYTKHHHLADTRSTPSTENSGGQGYSSGRDTLHAEAWRSGLVLTTFTQLLESLAGPGNVQSTKLPALGESVVIMDEPQAISLDWWGLVGRLTTYLTEEYDATVLFMTATQPRLLNHMPDAPTPTELVDMHQPCTEFISDAPRVEFRLHESLQSRLDSSRAEPLPLESAAQELEASSTDCQNTLAIVNTVGSATSLASSLDESGYLNLAEELLSYHRDTDGSSSFDVDEYLERLSEANPHVNRLLATLTTRLRPVDRRALLEAMSKILDPDEDTPFDDVPTVTVSTQLIEAGVDLSFDRLYRDYAPLPSVVQAAGRCNREFGGAVSEVTLWRLDSPEDANYVPSQLIYGDGEEDELLLRPTKTALSRLQRDAGGETLPESDVITEGVDAYYEVLHDQRRTDARRDDLVEAFDAARGEVLREASLITSDYSTADFLVLATDSERATHREYQRMVDANQWSSARGLFDNLKQTLVSVPVEEGRERGTIETIELVTDSTEYDVRLGQGLTDDVFEMDSEV